MGGGEGMAAEGPRSTKRRRILNWFLGTSLGTLCVSVAYPVLRYISPPIIPEPATSQIDAGFTNDPELIQEGFKILQFGLEPVILIRLSETDFRAFTATCTHLQCIVTYREPKKLIWCYCHNGVYDLNGRNIAGPPPRPLTPFAVHLVAGGPGQARRLVVSKS
jgi:Rieske Fe-S protein